MLLLGIAIAPPNLPYILTTSAIALTVQSLLQLATDLITDVTDECDRTRELTSQPLRDLLVAAALTLSLSSAVVG